MSVDNSTNSPTKKELALAKRRAIATAKRKTAFLICFRNSLAIISTACLKARIDRKTYYNWMTDDPEFVKEVESIQEEAIDFAESKLFELINGAKVPDARIHLDSEGKWKTKKLIKVLPPDTAATIFYLKTKGKARGYVEKTEVDLKGLAGSVVKIGGQKLSDE